jgi:hypothetical protein
MHRLNRLVLTSMAVFAVACGGGGPVPTATPLSITLLTAEQPETACDDALATGALAPDPRSGLGLRGADGQRTSVMWPFGYSAIYQDDLIQLVDPDGEVVAVEGEVVQMGGGFGLEGLFYACAGSVEPVLE